MRNDEFAQRLSVSADELMDLTEARARAAARLRIEVEGVGDVMRLRDALDPYRVTKATLERVVASSSATATVQAASTWPCPKIGACDLKIVYGRPRHAAKGTSRVLNYA